MSSVLYRKYRSQNFDELIGQDHITRLLKNSVKESSISHAYLFVGSRGTGKTSTARILAKAINCEDLSKDGNPCNECHACKSISNGSFLDLFEIDAASNRGIDQIRDLKERIEFSPSEGKYKVYIIDEVHMLTTEAFNALLKTLEEPPEHVIFMLATTDVHKLPATILSRCQRYDFKLGNEEQIKKVIVDTIEKEDLKIEDSAVDLLANNARGSYRDALSLLDVVISGQENSAEPKEITEIEVRSLLGIPDTSMVVYLLEKLHSGDLAEAFSMVRELDSKGVNIQQFVKYLLDYLRVELVDLSSSKGDSNFSLAEVLKLVNLLLDAERKLKFASDPSIVLDLVLAEFVEYKGNSNLKTSNRNNRGSDSPEPVKPKKEITNKTDDKEEVTNKLQNTSDTAKTISNGSADAISAAPASADNHETAEEANVESEEKEVSQALKALDKATEEDLPKLKVDLEKKISLADIKSSWDSIVLKVQEINGHLYAFLKFALVHDITDGFLKIEVPFEFHKDRIEAPKSREIINKASNDILGHNLPVSCIVNGKLKNKKKVSADVILKNIPAKPKADKQRPPNKKTSSRGKSTQKAPERKVSKKVEEIFADM